nr:MAG TPA: hypothetical protein [Bacteriophage sp.]
MYDVKVQPRGSAKETGRNVNGSTPKAIYFTKIAI